MTPVYQFMEAVDKINHLGQVQGLRLDLIVLPFIFKILPAENVCMNSASSSRSLPSHWRTCHRGTCSHPGYRSHPGTCMIYSGTLNVFSSTIMILSGTHGTSTVEQTPSPQSDEEVRPRI